MSNILIPLGLLFAVVLFAKPLVMLVFAIATNPVLLVLGLVGCVVGVIAAR